RTKECCLVACPVLAVRIIIKHHYRLRQNPAHYNKAKELCLLQISISRQAASAFKKPPKPHGMNMNKFEGKVRYSSACQIWHQADIQ
ncbi:hypothetical protein, partial [Shewanella algae]|uniref:hypothetical protein n=1 Tax=Shewanella algae TaxID=38313 RepID=UPI003005D36D